MALARQAQADGFELICATLDVRHDHDVRIEELAGRVAELNAVLEGREIGVRVATGGEVAERICEGLDAQDLPRVSLGGGGRWILLEPALGPLGDGLAHAVESLARRGCRGVIAHPERHPDRRPRRAAGGARVARSARAGDGRVRRGPGHRRGDGVYTRDESGRRLPRGIEALMGGRCASLQRRASSR